MTQMKKKKCPTTVNWEKLIRLTKQRCRQYLQNTIKMVYRSTKCCWTLSVDSWSSSPGLLQQVFTSYSSPHIVLLLVFSSWSPPPSLPGLLLIFTSFSSPPCLLLQISWLFSSHPMLSSPFIWLAAESIKVLGGVDIAHAWQDERVRRANLAAVQG